MGKGKQTQLDCDTAAYYQNMTEEELQDEQELERVICDVPRPDVNSEE